MFSLKLLYPETFHLRKACLHNAGQFLHHPLPRLSYWCTSKVSSFYFHLETLYLFTRSDFKTIIAPVVSIISSITLPYEHGLILASPYLFSYSSPWVPLHLSLSHAYLTSCSGYGSTCWKLAPPTSIWLHTRIVSSSTHRSFMSRFFNWSTLGLNKPWRPIPSGRISIRAAKMLSLALVPTCFAVSMLYDVLGFSVLFILASCVYNEGGLHSTWVAKQFLNALGYGSLELGATAIMGLSFLFNCFKLWVFMQLVPYSQYCSSRWHLLYCCCHQYPHYLDHMLGTRFCRPRWRPSAGKHYCTNYGPTSFAYHIPHRRHSVGNGPYSDLGTRNPHIYSLPFIHHDSRC